jgi:ribosome biogenesis GTP-binding protein YsxC/EngB
MKPMKAEFIMSAAHFKELPAHEGDEFCVMGRSNVGKSSFVNHVFENRALARVSGMPGKTILANVYKVSDGTTWVDLPGYGYARASKIEQVRWSRLIEEYCEKRKNLKGIIWLLDARHVGLTIDLEARDWLSHRRLPLLPVLMKCDKLTKAEIAAQMKNFIKTFGFTFAPVPFSSKEILYRERFWKHYEIWRNGGSMR